MILDGEGYILMFNCKLFWVGYEINLILIKVFVGKIILKLSNVLKLKKKIKGNI